MIPRNTKSDKLFRPVATLLSLVLAILFVTPVFAAYPTGSDNIYDGPDALSESTERQIKKVNAESKSGATISVCVVPGTDGMSIADYATGLFTAWKLGEGVLIVIDTSAPDYYLIQSSGIESKITTADLESVRDNYLEPDFNTGNIDSAVSKAVTKLSIDMSSRLAPSPADEQAKQEPGGPTFGSVIGTIFKVILILVLIVLVIFGILFVIALFNDDVAAILRKYVFDRFRKNKPASHVPSSDYDERLYGNRSHVQRPQNRPQASRYPQGQNRQGNYQRYPQQNTNNGRNPNSRNYQ